MMEKKKEKLRQKDFVRDYLKENLTATQRVKMKEIGMVRKMVKTMDSQKLKDFETDYLKATPMGKKKDCLMVTLRVRQTD